MLFYLLIRGNEKRERKIKGMRKRRKKKLQKESVRRIFQQRKEKGTIVLYNYFS